MIHNCTVSQSPTTGSCNFTIFCKLHFNSFISVAVRWGGGKKKSEMKTKCGGRLAVLISFLPAQSQSELAENLVKISLLKMPLGQILDSYSFYHTS